MRKLILISTLLIFACSSDDDQSSQDLFRSIYDGVSWYNEEWGYFSFSPSKLLFYNDEFECYFFEAGSYNTSNIDTDGCFYDTTTLAVVSETSSSFSFKDQWSDDSSQNGTGCQGGEVTFSFQIIDDNSLEFNDQEDTFIFTKTSEQFNPTGCINGTLDGYAW